MALARSVARVVCVAFSPTGRSFVAATPGALLVYSLDDGSSFAPFEVDEALTSDAVKTAVKRGESAKAVAMALQLGDAPLIRQAVAAVHTEDLALVVRGVPPNRAPHAPAAPRKPPSFWNERTSSPSPPAHSFPRLAFFLARRDLKRRCSILGSRSLKDESDPRFTRDTRRSDALAFPDLLTPSRQTTRCQIQSHQSQSPPRARCRVA